MTPSEDQNIQFTTAEQLNVTGRIKEGKTEKFTCRKEANKFADQKGSYIYDLFYFVVEGAKRSEVKPFGFAVPK